MIKTFFPPLKTFSLPGQNNQAPLHIPSLSLEEEKGKNVRNITGTHSIMALGERLFISKCRIKPVWAGSSQKKGQFEQSMEEGEG